MNRFIIRHLTGAQANQEVAYTAADLDQPLTLGRDPASRLSFNDADDAVSRQHARIERDGTGYKIVDLGSANGTFVNLTRVHRESPLAHGDIVQFGRGGPQASVHLDPPPAPVAKATRLVADAAGKPTRVAATEASVQEPSGSDAPARVGRATVERLITAEKSRSTRIAVNIVAGMIAVIGALGAWQFVDAKKRDDQTAAQIRGEREAADAKIAGVKTEAAAKVAALEARSNLSKRVKTDFGASTVFIEASWRLTETATGKPIYHAVMPVEGKGNLPAYIKLENGTYEPLLEMDDRGESRPIGGSHSGTGFVVSDNGVIMTNRHVAAAWHAPYDLPFPGVVVEYRKNEEKKETEIVPVAVLQEAPESLKRWIPSRSQQIKSSGMSDATKVTGTISSMTVTFPNSKLRTPATLGTISPEHDVALIKIDAPTGHLKKVEMRDSTDTLASGDAVAVLGYPAVSALAYVVTASSDTMVRSNDVASVPEVSVNQGIVTKVVHGSQTAGLGKYVSLAGDMFEMSINSTGQGNSGGPVFDSDGKVIGIFATVRQAGYAAQTGAVPIRYGLDLLDPTRAATTVASGR